MIKGVVIKHKDLVIALPKPNRHHDVIKYMVEVLGIEPPVGSDGQGFYLDDGTYLNRKEAMKYETKEKLLITTNIRSQLYSEDLW